MEAPSMIRTRNFINLAHQTSEDELEHLELAGSVASGIHEPRDEKRDKIRRQDYINDNFARNDFHGSSYDFPIEDEGNFEENNNNGDGNFNDNDRDLDDERRQNLTPDSGTIFDDINGMVTGTEPNDGPVVRQEDQVELLRELLMVERSHLDKRTQNNAQLSKYIAKLQSEFLNLQADLAATLESTKRARAQLECQISHLEETVKEKDRLIEQLRNHLDSLDESKLRVEFDRRLEQQRELSKMEKQQIEAKCETIEQQLVIERVSNSNLLQEFQSKIESQQRSHDAELRKLEDKIAANENELQILMSEPKNELIKNLREDKANLVNEVESLELVLKEARAKQDSLASRVQGLVKEAEQSRLNWEEEIDSLKRAYMEQRKFCNQIKLELMDKEEELQISEFNLERSDLRVKSLLETLKCKEEAYGNLIEIIDARHELQHERTTHSVSNLKQLVADQANQLDSKQNELTRLELKHQNQLESIRCDREERLANLDGKLQKLESELESSRAQLIIESENAERKGKLAEQYQKEASQFRAESERLALELEKKESNLVSKELLLEEQVQMLKQQQVLQHSNLESSENLVVMQTRSHVENLEKSLAMLRAENNRLLSKLQINEAVLSQANEAITKERNKLAQEYDNKLEQFKNDWRANDKSRIRYRKYGFKLKRYFEHLRATHEHVCDSNCCQLEPFKSDAIILND